MCIMAVRQTISTPIKHGVRRRAGWSIACAGFLLASIVTLAANPAGAADDGLCSAVSNPSAQDKPNDPETVCDCARAYLKHVGQAITEIRNQAQELVGKGFTQA